MNWGSRDERKRLNGRIIKSAADGSPNERESAEVGCCCRRAWMRWDCLDPWLEVLVVEYWWHNGGNGSGNNGTHSASIT